MSDIIAQSMLCQLTLVDQGSTETGTDKYLADLQAMCGVKIVRNRQNIGLNRIWNWFYFDTIDPYLCFLNNDMRIPPNFASDTIAILDGEPTVGCVVHKTYASMDLPPPSDLSYFIASNRFVQGYDFTMRRQAFTVVPEDLHMWGGDDWLFTNLYEQEWEVAVAISSPVVHYAHQSYRFFQGDRDSDITAWKKHGFPDLPHGWQHAIPKLR